jgi:hypothetical protein
MSSIAKNLNQTGTTNKNTGQIVIDDPKKRSLPSLVNPGNFDVAGVAKLTPAPQALK